jgi:signal transduction histidine kinase/CheY-like chemotaxis protein
MDGRDHREIRRLFDDYLQMYASRDDRLTAYFSEDFSGFTGGGDFLVKDQDEWVAITRQDFAQVKDPLRIELKDLAIQSLTDSIAVTTGFFTIHLPIEEHVLSRTVARLVLIFRKESPGWKICHSSISLPDGMVREGEVYPLKELEDRNQFLEEQIAQRTLQLSEAKKAAEAANIAKSQFLASVSHEIRTPLNSLVGFSTLARTTSDPIKLDQYHAILEQSSRSLMDLVNDILDMSKIESGRMGFEAVPFNLRLLVAGLEDQYRPLAEQKTLTLTVVVTETVPAWVVGDQIRLRQILANLLGNAVKFTEHGEVTCTVSMPEAGAELSLVRFEICDTGIGIPEISRDLLFQPFRQLDPSITRKFGGTGLGLAIVHSLVVMMKGSVTVESKEDRGSCFVVELPLPETEPLPDDLLAPSVGLPSGTVLVVEDNRFNRQLLEDILAAWRLQVIQAEDGWHALQLTEQRRFDLILLDIRMPDIDGIEVARRIRNREQERSEAPVPIIAITADADTATRKACLGAGIDAVLAKPVDPEQLTRAIATHLGGAVAGPFGKELQLLAQTCSDLGDNGERIRQYREMLLHDIDEELRSLLPSLDRGDRKELGRAAHSLTGLCGHLSSPEASELAARLQRSASSACPEEMKRVIEQMQTLFQSIMTREDTR